MQQVFLCVKIKLKPWNGYAICGKLFLAVQMKLLNIDKMQRIKVESLYKIYSYQ